ncbi:SRPBCC family protein [Patulibacter sp.]|uniref:SRPBCC family protein n=1 Tax=Patulibacter sp. TaxID=1912859 RepID=UPI00271668AD|nr:SRPBCC family protein [Patulibacter sp.]MDO9407169.1 SRPBCC family protein [Patulibacter sp.]
MLRYETATSAPPEVVWPLLARPDRWHEWAWHVRGAWGLGSPEVRAGALGAVRLLGVAPVPVRIVDVDPGRSWSWRAGPLLFVHRVDPVVAGGSVVGIDVDGPAPVLALVRRTYGPWCRHVTRVMAERAAADASSAASRGGW